MNNFYFEILSNFLGSLQSLADEIRRKTDNLLTDEEIEDICREVEAGRFDAAAADALQQELLRREAKRDEQEVPH